MTERRFPPRLLSVMRRDDYAEVARVSGAIFAVLAVAGLAVLAWLWVFR